MTAKDIPDDFKSILAGLYEALHENGVSRALFLDCLKEAGCVVNPSTLDRWVARLHTIGTAIIENKKTGAIPLLRRENRDVVMGWVLHENANGKIVSLASVFTFILDYFDVELSYPSITNYLNDDGFSCRLAQKKAKSFIVDIDALSAELWNWVIKQDFRMRGIKRDEFASIDFTFTSHRADRLTSFAPRGGPQPMVSEKISNFTNCIVTALWSDGINRTPPMLFTFNPAFRTDRNPTKKRNEQEAHFIECLKKYGIDESRIIYIGEDKKEMRKYARECPDLIRLFFEKYGVPPKCTIYSDEGNSFFENGKSVLR